MKLNTALKLVDDYNKVLLLTNGPEVAYSEEMLPDTKEQVVLAHKLLFAYCLFWNWHAGKDLEAQLFRLSNLGLFLPPDEAEKMNAAVGEERKKCLDEMFERCSGEWLDEVRSFVHSVDKVSHSATNSLDNSEEDAIVKKVLAKEYARVVYSRLGFESVPDEVLSLFAQQPR